MVSVKPDPKRFDVIEEQKLDSDMKWCLHVSFWLLCLIVGAGLANLFW